MNLFDVMAPVIAPTSLQGFERVVKKLPLVELLIVAAVDDYARATGYPNVTGRELADWLRRDVLRVRPRLTGARKAGWLDSMTPRKSRHPLEQVCAPYRCAVPRAAIDRAISQIRGQAKTVRIPAESEAKVI